jgi:hypothetical protein
MSRAFRIAPTPTLVSIFRSALYPTYTDVSELTIESLYSEVVPFSCLIGSSIHGSDRRSVDDWRYWTIFWSTSRSSRLVRVCTLPGPEALNSKYYVNMISTGHLINSIVFRGLYQPRSCPMYLMSDDVVWNRLMILGPPKPKPCDFEAHHIPCCRSRGLMPLFGTNYLDQLVRSRCC